MLTKKDDDRAAEEEIKRSKDERQAVSKAMAESWDTTTLNKMRKQLENRKKLMADIEDRQLERDAQIKREILVRRMMIIEKARYKKWSERDSTKALNRAVHKMEVLKERSIQMEFNKMEKKKALEEDNLMKVEFNLEAERYRNDRWELKLKQAEIKKTNADAFLKELKERESIKRCEDLKLIEDGKAELQRIAKEIEDENNKKTAKIKATREIMSKNLSDNREMTNNKNKLRQVEEQEENEVVAIMDEAKKRIARTRKLKDIELLKEKQTLLEKMSEKAYQSQAQKKNVSDLAFQEAVDEKERQYKKEELRKEEVKNKLKIELVNTKKSYDEETRQEKERLTLSYQWEVERRLREAQVLRELEELRRQAKVEEMNKFRDELDLQRSNIKRATMADKQADLKQYEELVKSWIEEDKEFMTYIKDVIETYKKAGRSIIPLLKAIKDYTKNNKLRVNAADIPSEVDTNAPSREGCI